MTGEGFMGIRHTYQRRGHFLEDAHQIYGPYRTSEELIAAYDRLAYLPHGIEVDRTAWPRLEEERWRVAVCESCGKLAMDWEQYDAKDWEEDVSESIISADDAEYLAERKADGLDTRKTSDRVRAALLAGAREYFLEQRTCVDKFKEEANP